jgi:peptide/nickel transport system permease protein
MAGNKMIVAEVGSKEHLLDNRTRSLGKRIQRSSFGRAVRNNPFSVVGLVIVFAFLVVALFPGVFATRNPTKLNLQDKFAPLSREHFLGADQMGMDVYSRVIYGARVTLRNVIVVLTIVITTGYLVGSTAGYSGGGVDEVLMRLTDVFLAFPTFILAMAVNAVLGRGLIQTVVAVGVSWWASYARLIRGQILSVKYEQYVIAARAIGAKPSRVLTRHILPNCFTPIVVYMTLDVGFVALATAGLSFLGLGVEPPTPEWGRMVAEGRNYLLQQWWVPTFPGLALFLVVVGFNLLGEIVRDWLDPTRIYL